ncbi:MAG TPA: hypothetical protein VJ021_07695 [Thermoplasmata archaeon]|nr:hypothetical protein [Thermoplasmata archaeon]
MPSLRDESSVERTGGLDERVLSTLHGLNGRIAFSGLRRVLHAHPESLSRSLRRLEREGLVERSDGGYRALGEVPRGTAPRSTDLRSIAQVDLPPGALPDSVLGRLSGRWFGSLRWVGVVEGPSGRLLAWARRDGADYVLLGIDRGVLRVYVRTETSGDDPNEAEDAAYELLVHAVDALRPSGPDPVASVSFFAAGDPPTGPPLEN